MALRFEFVFQGEYYFIKILKVYSIACKFLVSGASLISNILQQSKMHDLFSSLSGNVDHMDLFWIQSENLHSPGKSFCNCGSLGIQASNTWTFSWKILCTILFECEIYTSLVILHMSAKIWNSARSKPRFAILQCCYSEM